MIDDCVHKFYETANERKVVGRSDPKNVYTYCENGNKSLRSIALVRKVIQLLIVQEMHTWIIQPLKGCEGLKWLHTCWNNDERNVVGR